MRHFTGSRGSSGSNSTMGGSTGAPKHSSKDAFLNKMRNKSGAAPDAKERYDDIIQAKMNQRRDGGYNANAGMMMSGGAQQQQEMSKNKQKLLEEMARKKAEELAKKRAKKNPVVPKINAKMFTGIQGGRIDGSGRIFGPDGKMIATVNKKTGHVRAMNGTFITKYSHSSFCEFKIARFIANAYAQKGTLYGTAAAVHHAPAGFTDATESITPTIWGNASHKDIYGSGGSIWGSD